MTDLRKPPMTGCRMRRYVRRAVLAAVCGGAGTAGLLLATAGPAHAADAGNLTDSLTKVTASVTSDEARGAQITPLAGGTQKGRVSEIGRTAKSALPAKVVKSVKVVKTAENTQGVEGAETSRIAVTVTAAATPLTSPAKPVPGSVVTPLDAVIRPVTAATLPVLAPVLGSAAPVLGAIRPVVQGVGAVLDPLGDGPLDGDMFDRDPFARDRLGVNLTSPADDRDLPAAQQVTAGGATLTAAGPAGVQYTSSNRAMTAQTASGTVPAPSRPLTPAGAPQVPSFPAAPAGSGSTGSPTSGSANGQQLPGVLPGWTFSPVLTSNRTVADVAGSGPWRAGLVWGHPG